MIEPKDIPELMDGDRDRAAGDPQALTLEWYRGFVKAIRKSGDYGVVAGGVSSKTFPRPKTLEPKPFPLAVGLLFMLLTGLIVGFWLGALIL